MSAPRTPRGCAGDGSSVEPYRSAFAYLPKPGGSSARMTSDLDSAAAKVLIHFEDLLLAVPHVVRKLLFREVVVSYLDVRWQIDRRAYLVFLASLKAGNILEVTGTTF
eukprot:7051232-Heterocapsa_arctica.AAC.1